MDTVRGRKRKLPVADFLEAIEARLAAMKPAELRAALLTHAERLPPSERGAFLALFEASAESGETKRMKPTRRAPSTETLLRDIDAAIEMYEQSRGGRIGGRWEDDLEDDEWTDGESVFNAWPTAEMDALFQRADAAFREGDLALAREAYHKLLYAVAAYQEGGFDEDGFDDGETPEPLGQTDLSEAKARYLRALYETTGPDQRPAALLKAIQDLQYIGGEPVGLPEVIGARRAPLPDREAFLDTWIELLGRNQPGPYGFDPEVRRLLFQAVRLHRGTDGLAELARRDGRRLPEAYRKWILALAEEDKTAEAIGAAQEALRDLSATGEVRAWIAEFIAEDAEKRRDGPALLDARCEAFRAAPSTARLSALCEAAEPFGQLESVARAETTRLRAVLEVKSKRRNQEEEEADVSEGHRLLALLHLLGGEIDEAISLTERAPAVGWSGGEHPAPVVIPYLLVAATGGAEPASGTALADLWRGIDASEPVLPMWDLDTDEDAFDDEGEGEGPDARSKARLVRLTPFLRTVLQQRPPDPERRERFLKAAWNIAKQRVKAILEKKQRQAYERAATLVAAVAEARIVAGESDQGHSLLAEIRRQYSRYYAFTGELDKVARRSPLLPSPPSKPRRR